jgi:hypothetical protein
MALAPADFYAYSRATGVPVPEDPEERAEMAPEVLEFRRNQLKAPDQGSNLLGAVGAALAGAGILGGGFLGVRSLRGRKAQKTPQAPLGVNLTDLAKAKETPLRSTAPAPSKIADPWGAPTAIPQSTVDLTTIQQTQKPTVSVQATEAVDGGFDQAVDRAFTQPAQRDLDVTRVGGSSAQRFLERERLEIASQLGEQDLPITPSRIETELANRLGKGAYEYGPLFTARRQALELYAQTGSPELLEKVKRFGLSPVTFETFENMPAAKQAGFESAPPFTTSYYPDEEIVARGLTSNIEVDVPGMGRVNIADIRKPVITENTALTAEDYYQTKKGEALDWLGNLRVQLEPKRNQILKERRLLAEQRANEIIPQLEAAKNAGELNVAKDLEDQLQNLRVLWQNPKLGTHREDEMRLLNAQITGAQNKIQESIEGIQKKYPTTLENWSGEANRVFGELDVETGEFIPETMELRSERKMVDLTPKGGGGRNIGEYTAGERLDEEIRAIQGGGRVRDYDPETGEAVSPWTGDRTQTGRELGIYGVRLSSNPADNPELRPTDVSIPKAGLSSPYSSLDDETLGQLAMMGSAADQYNAEKEIARRKVAGEKIQLGGIQSTSEPLVQLPTESARRSVLMSEAVLKAARQQAARNPRGGVLPDEMTQLRMQMAQMQPPTEPKFTRRPPGPRPGAVPPQQLSLKGVSGYKSRQVKSPADEAAEQLEAYMGKLQRGRATPLTSEAVIQPRLF